MTDAMETHNTQRTLDQLSGTLIVSCQAEQGSPLRSVDAMVFMARAALAGGAAGLRANGSDDIRAIRATTDVPLIGLHKVSGPRRNIITPELAQAVLLAEAGADLIAIDATDEVLGSSFSYLTEVMEKTGRGIMADVSTLEEGIRATDAGAAVVGTTLSGYTPYSRSEADRPDLDLVERLADRGLRVIAEGRYRTAAEVEQAFSAGAFAVVVGGAITDPVAITARFAAVAPRRAETSKLR